MADVEFFIRNRVTALLGIKFPIIQGGMVWVSGWKLASAVSSCGGLGLIGAGSMRPELLREHVRKCRAATPFPFGVNLPLLREDTMDLARVVLEEQVPVVFTSAGHPARSADMFKRAGRVAVHVVSSVRQAFKAQSAGCDAVVGEGVEAGGHNGVDEITTMCLVPQMADALAIPVIAAGGIADGRGIAAALALGAEGVQIGTRFAATRESSAHDRYKESVLNASESGTTIILRKLGPVRAVRNAFASAATEEENLGAGTDRLKELLGSKREKTGIFEGDIEGGLVEAGQISGLIRDIPTVAELMKRLLDQWREASARAAG